MAVAAAISFEPFGSTALKVPCSPEDRDGAAVGVCHLGASGAPVVAEFPSAEYLIRSVW